MSVPSRVRTPLTLEQFLKLPEIDEHPAREYIDGKVEVKVAAQKKHCMIQKQLVMSLDAFAEPTSLGMAFPELRCTFAGRSIVPDVVFLLADHIDVDSAGELVNETFRPPDIHIEIASPDQPAKRNRERLQFSTANGCPLAWFIDPERRIVEVFRADGSRVRIADDGALEGEPVLPGYRVSVATVFGWLKLRVIRPRGEEQADSGGPMP
jgi:Uma2 family endonuclease